MGVRKSLSAIDLYFVTGGIYMLMVILNDIDYIFTHSSQHIPHNMILRINI